MKRRMHISSLASLLLLFLLLAPAALSSAQPAASIEGDGFTLSIWRAFPHIPLFIPDPDDGDPAGAYALLASGAPEIGIRANPVYALIRDTQSELLWLLAQLEAHPGASELLWPMRRTIEICLRDSTRIAAERILISGGAWDSMIAPQDLYPYGARLGFEQFCIQFNSECKNLLYLGVPAHFELQEIAAIALVDDSQLRVKRPLSGFGNIIIF